MIESNSKIRDKRKSAISHAGHYIVNDYSRLKTDSSVNRQTSMIATQST